MTKKQFDPTELMEIINSDSSPAELAAHLDDVLSIYVEYFFTDGCHIEPGTNQANTYHIIRMLRNALLAGCTGIDLSK